MVNMAVYQGKNKAFTDSMIPIGAQKRYCSILIIIVDGKQ
jgi:hypothetical protein